MHRRNRIGRIPLGVAALALALAAFAGVGLRSASASSVAITMIQCDSGLNHFSCDGYVTGGAPPYTFTWQNQWGTTIQGQDDGYDSSTTYGTCGTGYDSLNLTVRDSVGNTVTKGKTFYCYRTSGP